MISITNEMVERACWARYRRWRHMSEAHRQEARDRIKPILTAALAAAGERSKPFHSGQTVTITSAVGDIHGVIVEEVEGWWKIQFYDGSHIVLQPSRIHPSTPPTRAEGEHHE